LSIAIKLFSSAKLDSKTNTSRPLPASLLVEKSGLPFLEKNLHPRGPVHRPGGPPYVMMANE
jgi:hypothetical protein